MLLLPWGELRRLKVELQQQIQRNSRLEQENLDLRTHRDVALTEQAQARQEITQLLKAQVDHYAVRLDRRRVYGGEPTWPGEPQPEQAEPPQHLRLHARDFVREQSRKTLVQDIMLEAIEKLGGKTPEASKEDSAA